MIDLIDILTYVTDTALVKVWLDTGGKELPVLINGGYAEDIVEAEEAGIYKLSGLDEYEGYIDIYVKEIN